MPFASVTVDGQDGRNVYIDGNYDSPAPRKAPGPFFVASGSHVFETLDRRRRVDNRAKVRIRPDQETAETEFDAVDPPEETEEA
ncbi:MAG TPA: hypothetical protein VG889_17590 [Rhizomicrobium sp.]|nr:hypothetical protein [Rhizomicrobium sp.]